jgi:hypothetical protein
MKTSALAIASLLLLVGPALGQTRPSDTVPADGIKQPPVLPQQGESRSAIVCLLGQALGKQSTYWDAVRVGTSELFTVSLGNEVRVNSAGGLFDPALLHVYDAFVSAAASRKQIDLSWDSNGVVTRIVMRWNAPCPN